MRSAVRDVALPQHANSRALRARAVSSWAGLAPCLAYLFVEFARPATWVPALQPLRLGMLAAAFGCAAAVLRLASGGTRILRPVWLMFAFWSLMGLHVVTATNNFWAFEGFRDFAIVLFGLFLPVAILPRNLAGVRRLMTAYVMFHIPLALFGMLNRGRGLGSWIADENDLSLALNAALGVAIFLLLETRSLAKRLWLGGAMAMMIGCQVLTMSRGGFVGLAALAAYLIVDGTKRGAVILLIVLALVGLLILAPAEYWGEMGTITGAGQAGDTGDKRQYYWGMAWRMYLDHPLTGVGTLNYGIRAPEYEDRDRYHRSTWGRAAHSLYFTLLAEQGTLGTLLFLAMVVWFARNVRRLRLERIRMAERPPIDAALLAKGIAAGMVGALTAGAFLSVLYYPIFWLLLSLLAALVRVTPPAERA